MIHSRISYRGTGIRSIVLGNRMLLAACCALIAVPGLAQHSEKARDNMPDALATSSRVQSSQPTSTQEPETAAEDLEQDIANRELSVAIGEMTLYPLLNAAIGYRSNAYDRDGQKQDSGFLNLRVGAGVQGENRGHLYGAEYMAERVWYENDDVQEEDEISQRLVGYWGTGFTTRNNLDLGIEYLDSYDPRGLDDPIRGRRDTSSEEDPDTWTQLSYGLRYVYGAPDASGRLELGACKECREYDNNDQEYRDGDIIDLGAAFYVRMTGRSDGFLQVVYSDFDYEGQSPGDPSGGRDRDSEEIRYMVGAEWRASAKTTGIVRVGVVDKQFDDPVGRSSDYKEPTWDAVVNWTPGNRDRVLLSYSRAPREALVWESEELLDDYIEVEDVKAAWFHEFGQSWRTHLDGYVGEDTWEPSGRKDDLWGVSAGVRYQSPRWGSIGLSYFHRERDSSDPASDYDDQGWIIDLNIGALFGFGNSRAPRICLMRQFEPMAKFNRLAPR